MIIKAQSGRGPLPLSTDSMIFPTLSVFCCLPSPACQASLPSWGSSGFPGQKPQDKEQPSKEYPRRNAPSNELCLPSSCQVHQAKATCYDVTAELANGKFSGMEFTVGPVVRTWSFHYHVPGSTPGWGTKIPQATQCGQNDNNMVRTF